MHNIFLVYKSFFSSCSEVAVKLFLADIILRKRTRILTLSQHCGYAQRAIASVLGVSETSLSRVTRQHAETDSVVPKRKGKWKEM